MAEGGERSGRPLLMGFRKAVQSVAAAVIHTDDNMWPNEMIRKFSEMDMKL